MILDTCFLIDLQLEARRGDAGAAIRFLRQHASAPFAISVISVTEFLEGFEEPSEGERLLQAYARIDVNSSVATQVARIRRHLRVGGKLIGDFDIFIAATALSERVPLVTRNITDFSSIDGLELIAY